jgi:O-antigen ligase
MRGGDIVQFTRFLGIAEKQESTSADVQTYAQRTVLVYIGWRIFLDNPVVGAGFHASNDPAVFEPELPAAKARYPDAAPLSFPSRENPWGVQNAYVQALADLGAVGLVLLLAALAAALATAVRLAYRGAAPAIALVAGGWVLVAAGVWSALGLVSGVPADATLWLGVGLAGAAILVDREAREGRADAAA